MPMLSITVIPARGASACAARESRACGRQTGYVVTRSEASALTFSAIQSFQVVADHLPAIALAQRRLFRRSRRPLRRGGRVWTLVFTGVTTFK